MWAFLLRMSSRPRVVGRFASLPCLLDVCRRMSRYSSPSSCQSGYVRVDSFLYSASSRYRCRCRCRPVPWLLAFRPASSTRRAGRYGCRCGGSRLCLLDYRLAISSVRFSIGWRRMWSLPRPMTIICADCYPLARPIRFTHRLIISSSPLPDHSTRGTGRGLLPFGCLLLWLVRYYGSICLAGYLCGFC